MNKIRTSILLLTLAFTCQRGVTYAQDMHFSQAAASPMHLNPACTGAFTGDLRVVMNYRNQWNSVSVPFRTMAASIDAPILKNRWSKGYLGAGMMAFSDRAGDGRLTNNGMNLYLSSTQMLAEHHLLSVGLQSTFAQRSIDYSAFQWGSQYDGMEYNQSLPSGESSGTGQVFYADITGGLAWQFSQGEGQRKMSFSNGMALHHINTPNANPLKTDGDPLKMRFVLHGNGLISIPNTNVSWNPGYWFMKQGSANELVIGTNIRYGLGQASRYTGAKKESAVVMGVWYRNKDAIIVTGRIDFQDYKLGISYDLNSSQLSSASNVKGGPELLISYIKPIKQSREGSLKNVRFL